MRIDERAVRSPSGVGTEPPQPLQAELPEPPCLSFDLAAAMRRFDGDVELFDELAGMLLQSGPELMEQIREGLARDDLDAVTIAAHTLKGSVGNFEAGATSRAATNLDLAARQKDMPAVRKHAETLQVEFGRFIEELTRYVRKHAAVSR